MKIISLPKTVLSLFYFAETDTKREVLCGIYFDKDVDRAIATDGHILNQVDFDCSQFVESIVIPVSELKRIKAAGRKQYLGLSIDNGTLSLVVTDLFLVAWQDVVDTGIILATSIIKLSENKYPNYKAVLPSFEPVYRFSLSAYCMDRLAKAMKMSGSEFLELELGENGLGPIKLSTLSATIDGLVMPCRIFEDKECENIKEIGLLSKEKEVIENAKN